MFLFCSPSPSHAQTHDKSGTTTINSVDGNDGEPEELLSLNTLDAMAALLDLRHEHVDMVCNGIKYTLVRRYPSPGLTRVSTSACFLFPFKTLVLRIARVLRERLRATQHHAAAYARTLARTAYAYGAMGYTEQAGRWMESAAEACPPAEAEAVTDVVQLELQLYRARQELAHHRAETALTLLDEAAAQAEQLLRRETAMAAAAPQSSDTVDSSLTARELLQHIGALRAEALASMGQPGNALACASRVWRERQQEHEAMTVSAEAAQSCFAAPDAEELASDPAESEAERSFSSDGPKATAQSSTAAVDQRTAPPQHLRWQLLNDFLSSLQQLGHLYRVVGRPHTALLYLKRAARYAELAGGPRAHAWFLLLVAEVQCALGDVAGAETALAEAEQQVAAADASESAAMSSGARHLRMVLAVELAWRRGQVAQVRGALQQALTHYADASAALEGLMDPAHIATLAEDSQGSTTVTNGAATPKRVAALRRDDAAATAPLTPRTRGRTCGPWSSRFARLCGLRLALQAQLGCVDTDLQAHAVRCPASPRDRIWLLLGLSQAAVAAHPASTARSWLAGCAPSKAVPSEQRTLESALADAADGMAHLSVTGSDAIASAGLDGLAAELSQLRVSDLKMELKALGLAVSGRKAELVERLCHARLAADVAPETLPAVATEGTNGTAVDVDAATHPALRYLEEALALGPQAADATCQRQLHFQLALALGRCAPRRAFYHHHEGLGVAARLESTHLSPDRQDTALAVTTSNPEGLLNRLASLPVGMTVVGLAHDGSGQLIASRWRHGSAPVLLRRDVPAALEATSLALRLADADDASAIDEDEDGRAQRAAVDDDTVACHAERMAALAAENTQSIAAPTRTEAEKAAWWKRRRRLDARLGCILKDTERALLGPWRGLLLGELADSSRQRALDEEVSGNWEIAEHGGQEVVKES